MIVFAGTNQLKQVIFWIFFSSFSCFLPNLPVSLPNFFLSHIHFKTQGASGTIFPAHTAPPAGCIDLATSPEKHTMECIRDVSVCLAKMIILGQDASTKKYAPKYSFDAASTLALQQMICEENKGKDVTDVSDNVFYVFLFSVFFFFFFLPKKIILNIFFLSVLKGGTHARRQLMQPRCI